MPAPPEKGAVANMLEKAQTTSEEIQSLYRRLERVEAIQEIEKLQSRYCHYLLKHEYDRIVDDCFAHDTDDVSVEFSDSGMYRGQEKVRRLYSEFNALKDMPGFFILHMTVNPYIEVAADGLSAKSSWLSPGCSGRSESSTWIWGVFYVDYVKERGRWRIQHTNFSPIFRNKYEVSWAKAEDHGTVRTFSFPPDAPPSIYRPYSELKRQPNIFSHHPKLPEPF